MAREARNRILARWSPSQGRSSSPDLNTIPVTANRSESRNTTLMMIGMEEYRVGF